METTRSHSITTQMVGPDEAEDPGRADSAQQSCRHRVRGDWAGDGIVVLSSPQPFMGFPESQLCPAGRPSSSFRIGAQRTVQEFGNQQSIICCLSKGVSS